MPDDKVLSCDCGYEVTSTDGPLSMPGREVPPAGRAMSFEAAVLWTTGSDGLIVEERSYFDTTGVAAQLGRTG